MAMNTWDLSLVQVAAQFGVGRRTVLRWIRLGVAGVRLGAVHAGGQWRTNEAEVREFLRRLNAPGPAPRPPTPAQRRRAHERAVADLATAGVVPR